MKTIDAAGRSSSPLTIRARNAEESVTGTQLEEETPTAATLALVFAPLHKRAFGTAVGLALGLLLSLLTVLMILRAEEEPFPFGLLDQYFYGYDVTWMGAVIALFWGFVVGFVAGWFFAFVRNLVLAISLFAIRTRAQLAASRDFLDHI
jgi:hypothetical protein